MEILDAATEAQTNTEIRDDHVCVPLTKTAACGDPGTQGSLEAWTVDKAYSASSIFSLLAASVLLTHCNHLTQYFHRGNNYIPHSSWPHPQKTKSPRATPK
jgi:hypothetical protein